MSTEISVDELAQVIRQADGQNSLGAGALAEAILAKLPHLAVRQPVGEPITVEAVAAVRRNVDGDRYIDWLTEGGIADLEVGDVLMVSDRAITDEDGSGEVYAAPPAQAVDLGAVRDVFRRWHANELNSTDAMLALVEALAVMDSQAVGK